MGLRRWVRRLEKEAEGETVAVPLSDGTVRRFPKSALRESFMTNIRRLRGEDVPHHPLGVAAAQSRTPSGAGPSTRPRGPP